MPVSWLKFHKSNAERIPESEWVRYKEELIILYIEKGKTLKEIVQYMKEQYQFTAS